MGRKRGFAGIGLDRCRCPDNLGGAMRAAACYQADFIILGGERMLGRKLPSTDTAKAWRHIPLFQSGNLMDAIPYGAEPIAVEVSETAESLFSFQHPEQAFYIFGPEDGSISEDLLGRCQRRVTVPTAICMNLAATVNVVLYDRAMKRNMR